MVGLRLHSLILAAIQSTPFVSIDYDIKIQGFMERMNSPEYLTNTGHGLDTLYENAKKALVNQKEYSKHIKKHASHLRKLINTEADNMVRILTQRTNEHNRT